MLMKKGTGCICKTSSSGRYCHDTAMKYITEGRCDCVCVCLDASLFSRWFTLGAGPRHGVSTLGSSDTGRWLCPVLRPYVGVSARGGGLGPGAE